MGYQTKSKTRLISLWLLCAASTGFAAEEESESELDIPNLEFLEFLGSFETDDGEWIDPESLLSDEFEDLLNAAPIFVPADQDNDSANANNRRQ
jgi:hypothetical protein